jgi:Tfp pilus assembly protein PilO
MFKGRRGPLVAGAICLALVILLIFFLVLPKMSQVSSARDDLAAAEAQTSTLESQLAGLEQAELNAPEYKATIEEVEQQIPPTLDQSGYLLLIKNAAARSSVSLTTLTPAAPTLDPLTGLSAAPLAISAAGTYFSLTEFLYSLETLPRVAKVLNVVLAPSSGDSTDASVTTTTGLLSMQANVVLYTSDINAGPGSEPGPTAADDAGAATAAGG